MASVSPHHIVALLLLLSVAMGARPASAQQNETRVALVIGNASYPDAEAPLRDPINNARTLADELRRSGFEVDVGENLTKEAMRVAFDRFYGKIKPGSTALVFFSGYGIQSDRQTYVIPVNAQIWTEADVRRDGYSLDLVLGEMNNKGAAIKIERSVCAAKRLCGIGDVGECSSSGIVCSKSGRGGRSVKKSARANRQATP